MILIVPAQSVALCAVWLSVRLVVAWPDTLPWVWDWTAAVLSLQLFSERWGRLPGLVGASTTANRLRAAEKNIYPVLLVFWSSFGVVEKVAWNDYAPVSTPWI
jgi:hypothetical protein